MSELDEADVYSICPEFVQRTAGVHPTHIASLLRFRLGAHDLPVATGRWGRRSGQSLPRAQRLCSVCNSGSVGDEFHMVFECNHYASERERFSHLFQQFGGYDSIDVAVSPDGPHMQQFMNQDKRSVAAFVHSCWLKRCNASMQLVEGPGILQVLESDVEVDSDDILHVSIDVLLGQNGASSEGAEIDSDLLPP